MENIKTEPLDDNVIKVGKSQEIFKVKEIKTEPNQISVADHHPTEEIVKEEPQMYYESSNLTLQTSLPQALKKHQTRQKKKSVPYELPKYPMYEKVIKCSSCGFATSNVSNLSEHNCTSVRLQSAMRCNLCSFTSTDRKDFSKHMKSHFISNKLFICKYLECEYETVKEHDFKQHMRTHTDGVKFDVQYDQSELIKAQRNITIDTLPDDEDKISEDIEKIPEVKIPQLQCKDCLKNFEKKEEYLKHRIRRCLGQNERKY